MTAVTSVVVAESDVVSCELGGGLALLDLRSGTYYSINKVGAYVWDLLAEPRPLTDVCDTMAEAFEVDRQRCEADVVELITGLEAAGLVRVSDGAPA